jgi:hypothetical protein
MTLRFVPNTYTLDEQRQEINNLASDVNAIDTDFNERVDDRLSALLSGGTGISATYNDAGNSLALAIDFTEFNTDSLTEGTSKLFFTELRARQSFSIAAEPTASGNGDLSYNNSTGVFTYTPAAFTLNDVTTNGSTTTNSISVGSLTATSGNINVATGQAYRINNTNVLTATTLGSGVIASSLTSVGTLSSLTVTGAITANGGVNVATGQTYQINGNNVLTSTTLGSGITSSSLTSVGTLASLTVTGAITANGGINLGDNDKILFGDGNDLEIFHDGANSVIADSGTGKLLLFANDGLFLQSSVTEYYVKCNSGAAVEIYHNNVKKLETTTSGITVSGSNINLSTSNTPASATATGTSGDIRWDADYIYVCVATNTWKRSAISTWT